MKRLIAAGLVMGMCTSCAYVDPLVRGFNVISVPQEREIGDQVAQEVARQMTLVNDPSVVEPVAAIGAKLVQALPVKEFDYQFYVVRDNNPNAFTIPGGRIYVHTGLLHFVGNRDELAGVLAHEIAHAVARHPAKNISRAYGVDSLAGMLFSGNDPVFSRMAFNLAKGGLLSQYGREDEYEADSIGLDLLRRSGFRVSGLRTFLERIAKINRTLTVPFFSSHPPTADRIARLQSMEQGNRPSTPPVQRQMLYPSGRVP